MPTSQARFVSMPLYRHCVMLAGEVGIITFSTAVSRVLALNKGSDAQVAVTVAAVGNATAANPAATAAATLTGTASIQQVPNILVQNQWTPLADIEDGTKEVRILNESGATLTVFVQGGIGA